MTDNNRLPRKEATELLKIVLRITKPYPTGQDTLCIWTDAPIPADEDWLSEPTEEMKPGWYYWNQYRRIKRN